MTSVDKAISMAPEVLEKAKEIFSKDKKDKTQQ